jgi:hypothetical protein
MKGSSGSRKLTMKLVARIFRQKGGQVNSYLDLYLRCMAILYLMIEMVDFKDFPV